MVIVKIEGAGLKWDGAHTVSRVPCHGEYISLDDGEAAWRVDTVIHRIDANHETDVVAYVRVRG